MPGTSVTNPNLGLYLDRAPIALEKTMLQDGLNFRVKQGKVSNLSLGWEDFGITLNGPATMIANLALRNGSEVLLFASLTDIYSYSTSGGGSVSYITPIYNTGTVTVSGTAVTGAGTAWTTIPTGSQWANAKIGDEIAFGSASQVNPAATWYTISGVGGAGAITLSTSAGTIGAGSTYTIRRKFTGNLTNIWEYDTFVYASPQNEDQIFITNGIDNVVRWNGSDAQVTLLTGLGFTCKTLIQFKNMIIYQNLNDHGTSKPTDIVNSDVGSPSAAGDAGSGLSEQFRIHGGTDGVITSRRLGDYLAIYCEKTIVLTYFTGDALVFVFRVVVAGKGPVGPRAVAVYPDRHQFVGPDAMYVFDGSLARPYAEHVWREIIRTQDPARIGNIFNVLDEQNGDQVWSVPATVDPGVGDVTKGPTQAWAEHYLEEVGSQRPKPYSKRSFPFTSVGFYTRQSAFTWDQLTNAWNSYSFRWNDQFFAAAFPLILVGDEDGHIYTLNTSQNAGSSTLSSFIKFGRRPLLDGKMRGLVARVYPFMTAFNSSLNVTVHLADHALGASTINATFPFDQTLPQGGHFISAFRRGRFVEIEFGTDGSLPWELGGYDMDIRQGGMR